MLKCRCTKGLRQVKSSWNTYLTLNLTPNLTRDSDFGWLQCNLSYAFHFQRHLYTQRTESTHHRSKRDALPTL